MLSSTVLHLGSGAIGLGMVVPQFEARREFDIYVANRNGKPDSPSKQKNDILKLRKNYSVRNIDHGYDSFFKIKDFFFLDEDNESILRLLEQDQTVYLTTALKKEGIDSLIGEISLLVKHRLAKKLSHPLIVIACENAVNSTYMQEQIMMHLGDFDRTVKITNHVLFLNCVVDRICTIPEVVGPNVVLYAEKYCSWIIDVTPIQSLKNAPNS